MSFHDTEVIFAWESIFRCPLCANKMKMMEPRSLVCTNRHCFDISKYGYINFLSRPHSTKYTKQLYKSRRTISQSGFFDPLLSIISNRVIDDLRNGRCTLLDAGCGEGFNLYRIQDMIRQNTTKEVLAVGLDISKEGIQLASKEYPGTVWCVADLAKAPFFDNKFDYIFNFLSPANYAEFLRLLKKDGVLIKVIPEGGYLQELRKTLYQNKLKQVYSNSGTERCFYDNMDVLESKNVRYTVALDGMLIKDLIYMTPLFWDIIEKETKQLTGISSLELTVDLKILFGKKSIKGNV